MKLSVRDLLVNMWGPAVVGSENKSSNWRGNCKMFDYQDVDKVPGKKEGWLVVSTSSLSSLLAVDPPHVAELSAELT